MAVNTAEIAGLADRTRRVRLRLRTEGSLGCLDIPTILINAIVSVIISLGTTGISWECGGRPQDQCEEEERSSSKAHSAAFVAWIQKATGNGCDHTPQHGLMPHIVASWAQNILLVVVA